MKLSGIKLTRFLIGSSAVQRQVEASNDDVMQKAKSKDFINRFTITSERRCEQRCLGVELLDLSEI